MNLSNLVSNNSLQIWLVSIFFGKFVQIGLVRYSLASLVGEYFFWPSLVGENILWQIWLVSIFSGKFGW